MVSLRHFLGGKKSLTQPPFLCKHRHSQIGVEGCDCFKNLLSLFRPQIRFSKVPKYFRTQKAIKHPLIKKSPKSFDHGAVLITLIL